MTFGVRKMAQALGDALLITSGRRPTAAGTPEEYVTTLQTADFVDFGIEDRRVALLDMVSDVRRKLLGVTWQTQPGRS